MHLLSLADATISYRVSGTGASSLVLVHGGMCDHRDWERLVPLLERAGRVVTLDLRGHGASSGSDAGCTVEGWAEDLLALIRALALARPILVGHSLASRIVVEAASRAPAEVGGVVLLDGSRSHGGHAAAPPAEATTPPSLDAVIEATIGPFADANARAAVTAQMASASPAIMAACVEAMREWDLGRADAAFAALAGTVQVLAVQSTYHDLANSRRSLRAGERSSPYLDFVREAVPQTEVAVLPDTGHFIMLERPGIVAELILNFAERSANV